MKKIVILILIITDINYSIAIEPEQLGERMSKYMDLKENELDKLINLATKNDFRAAVRLGNYYTYLKGDKTKAMNWFLKASELGSFDGMLNVAFSLNFPLGDADERIDLNNLNNQLMLMTSLGLNEAKQLYLKLCKDKLNCNYSQFYQQVELAISDSSEYSRDFMCLFNQKAKNLNVYEMSIVNAMSKVFSDDFKEYYKCGTVFFSDDIQSLIHNKSDELLVEQIVDWLRFYTSDEKHTSRLSSQEKWLYNYTRFDLKKLLRDE